jgi:LysR family transcriptional regulator, nitrogen assimilation regulatory protein
LPKPGVSRRRRGPSTSPSRLSASKSPSWKPHSASRFCKGARGIKPTAAGQRFYEKASSILRRYENLPGLVRSSIGDVEGLVSVGMPGSLSTTLVGPFIESCRATYPKITLRITDADSDSLREEVEKGRLDLALPFEDEFFPVVHRRPLFRQNHYLISSKDAAPTAGPTISLTEVAKIPLACRVI